MFGSYDFITNHDTTGFLKIQFCGFSFYFFEKRVINK